MQCDVQSLLDDARCFATLNPSLRSAVALALWCDVAEGISNISSGNPFLQNIDDSLWYQFNATELGAGIAIPNIGQTPGAAGVNPYLVIVNLDDGLKYKVRLSGTPPAVFWDIDPSATLEAETPTTISAGGNNYTLDVFTDGGLTLGLTPV